MKNIVLAMFLVLVTFGAAFAQFLDSDSTEVTVIVNSTIEVPGPSQALFNNPWYTCVRNFYVSTTGNDSNNGTSASTPWKTLQHADTTSRTGGDCINVAPGTYRQNLIVQHGGNAPTATGYVAYRCQTLDGCHITAPANLNYLFSAFYGGNFLIIDGFELDGTNFQVGSCFGTGDQSYGGRTGAFQAGASSHHLWIMNSILHHCGLSGIQFADKEYFYSIHNTSYHNSYTGPYYVQGSGISFVAVQCIQAGGSNCYTSAISGVPASAYSYVPSGNDTATFNQALGRYAPFHNVVAWNVVYNNRVTTNTTGYQGSGIACGSHTDGNGIIMDTFLDDPTNTYPYPYQTLVLNNVSYYNGGRGVHIFDANNVTVANNTVFDNITDTCITGRSTTNGELSQQGGVNNVWINNVSKPVDDIHHQICSFVAGNGGNSATTDINDSYQNNVITGLNGSPCLYDNDRIYWSCSNNKCNTDPGYVNATPGAAGDVNGNSVGGTWIPGNSNFAITGSSPANNYVVSPAPSWMPAQNVDAGACHHSLTTCPNPGTTNY